LFKNIVVNKLNWFDWSKYFVDIIGDLFDEIYSFKYSVLTYNEWIWFNNWQKPEKLLKRILLSTTNPNDLVLDYFAWSWTTCAVAQKMWRK